MLPSEPLECGGHFVGRAHLHYDWNCPQFLDSGLRVTPLQYITGVIGIREHTDLGDVRHKFQRQFQLLPRQPFET
jgi:hypothetical protein